MNSPRAFTLIELLVVVGIISILASIAVPNFLEAQTRAKVSRVKADMRSIAVALESYAVDFNKYPPRRQPDNSCNSIKVGDVNVRAADLSRITSPIAYMSKVPTDVFENRVASPNNLLEYWDSAVLDRLINPPHPPRCPPRPSPFPTGELPITYTGQPPWVLLSVGPDSEIGVLQGWANMPYKSIQEYSYLSDYDPSNGTISDGNVYRGSGNETALDIKF